MLHAAWETRRIHKKFQADNLEAVRNLGDLAVEGMILLE